MGKQVFPMQISLCLPLSTLIKPSRLRMNCLTFLHLFSAFSLLPVEDWGIKLLMTGKDDRRLRGKWITWETLSFWSWKYLVYENSSPAVSNKAAAITSSLGARVNTVSDFLYRYVKLAIPRKVHIFLNCEEKKINTRGKKSVKWWKHLWETGLWADNQRRRKKLQKTQTNNYQQ